MRRWRGGRMSEGKRIVGGGLRGGEGEGGKGAGVGNE